MPTRIWKKPTLSRSPPLMFVRFEATSAAMTGSSGGSPAADAPAPIQRASACLLAPSPGYRLAPVVVTAAASGPFDFDPPQAAASSTRSASEDARARRDTGAGCYERRERQARRPSRQLGRRGVSGSSVLRTE